MTKKSYTDREGCKDVQRIEEAIKRYNNGECHLDEWIMAIFTIAMQAREARLQYLWSGLYTMGENIPGGKKP